MNEEIGPTPLGKFIMFLFIFGCVFAAAVNFSPSLKKTVYQTLGLSSSTGTETGTGTGAATGGDPFSVAAGGQGGSGSSGGSCRTSDAAGALSSPFLCAVWAGGAKLSCGAIRWSWTCC